MCSLVIRCHQLPCVLVILEVAKGRTIVYKIQTSLDRGLSIALRLVSCELWSRSQHVCNLNLRKLLSYVETLSPVLFILDI